MIYVDDYRANFRGFKMSHLCAVPHSTMELNLFAEKLKLKASWFQKDRFGGHYDVSESKRQMAIRLGAISLNPRELVRLRLNDIPAPGGEGACPLFNLVLYGNKF